MLVLMNKFVNFRLYVCELYPSHWF